jgi:hypothetical protein
MHYQFIKIFSIGSLICAYKMFLWTIKTLPPIFYLPRFGRKNLNLIVRKSQDNKSAKMVCTPLSSELFQDGPKQFPTVITLFEKCFQWRFECLFQMWSPKAKWYDDFILPQPNGMIIIFVWLHRASVSAHHCQVMSSITSQYYWPSDALDFW